jgi:Cu(I)/Ag(I) efflux system membrane fusion protein
MSALSRSGRRIVAAALLVASGAAAGAWIAAQKPHWLAAVGLDALAERPPSARRILYYRHPMGLPETSPVPKKDSMGMDYIPVYAGEDDGDRPGAIVVPPDRVQKLGVRTVVAERRPLVRIVRAPASIQFDENRQATVTARSEGWIESVAPPRSGDRVARGDALFELYSPELHRLQLDFVTARRNRQAALAESALTRLASLGVARQDLEALAERDEARRLVPMRAPIAGVVVERKIMPGMRASPGEALYRIVDDSTVWAIAEIYENDLAFVAPGAAVSLTVPALPGARFAGRIGAVYPVVERDLRTVRVRIDVPNPDGLLRAGMLAEAVISVPLADGDRVVLPESAVIDGGRTKAAIVEREPGRFEPRDLVIGRRAGGMVEILFGVATGEKVVVDALFLLDSEANLRAALRALAPAKETGP